MSILENLLGLIVVLFIGYLIAKTGWKLRYLAPAFFLVTSIFVMILLIKLSPSEWEKMHFFSDGKLANELAMQALILSCGAGSVITFLLVLSVWAIRKNVFFLKRLMLILL
ncbi:hypothetical protein GJV03_17705 [Acinetobacter sp. RIT698]|uniref:hypothetical protein n=1 Tax=Acinetobacter sp. RIT698 TaxID=2666192 RepID=UPI0012ACF148|nr:hypothetical protein [Acinetobacter sp. RIT698]MRT38996.1 hypothetical protein [Acinetobacter sp. RIT698]